MLIYIVSAIVVFGAAFLWIAFTKYKPKTRDELVDLINDPKFNSGLSRIDTSRITDMSYLFARTIPNGQNFPEKIVRRLPDSGFKGIETWDVSNVTTMDYMFAGCEKRDVKNCYGDYLYSEDAYYTFNEDISKWNVSKVTSMEGMFFDCDSFDQSLND